VEHESHCHICSELQAVLNVDMERFIQPVPFRAHASSLMYG
jgi:hypothetical protein